MEKQPGSRHGVGSAQELKNVEWNQWSGGGQEEDVWYYL